MSRIKLSITMNIGEFTLIRCYTYSKRKHTKFLYKFPLALALSNLVLRYTADPAIIKIQKMAKSNWLYLIVFIRVFRSSFLMNSG